MDQDRRNMIKGVGLGAAAVLAAGAQAGGLAGFDAYPRVEMHGGVGAVALAVALVAVGLAPFLDRRGIAR
jgi:hypothetical protein